MASRVDFTSQDYFRNPAAAIEKLRGQGPVVEVRFPIIGKVWATTTQAPSATDAASSSTTITRCIDVLSVILFSRISKQPRRLRG